MKPNLRMKYYTAILSAFGTASMCTLSTAPAGAAEQAVPTRTVRFDDLDITKPAGAKILYDRIKAAAAEVCQPSMSREPLTMAVVQRNCVQKAIDNAVMKVNSDVLTELRFGSGIRLASK
ncbi:MAG: UrcA family protein [Steroidobacteraceae bacterium]